MEKLKGIWPLPGGSREYMHSLLKILEKINGGISEGELEVWMRNTFNLTGKKAIGGYIRVVEEDLGLLDREGAFLKLNASAKRFLETRNYSFLLNILMTRMVGFEEVFRILSNGHPRSLKEIHQNLVKLCQVNWTKNIQPQYRLNWLASLGYVDSERRGYFLTQKGLDVARQLPEHPTIEFPTTTVLPMPTALGPTIEMTHPEMIRLMKDLGEVFGFESWENVRLGDIVDGLDEELKNRTLDVLWKEKYRMIPIEVQAHGSIDSLLNRLEIVEPKSSKMIIVSTHQEFQRIKSYLEFKTRSFKDKVVHISPEELSKVKNHVEFVKNLRKKVS
jgi:hypothetical protein